MQAQLVRQRRDTGATAERLSAFGQRARAVSCRGWTKRSVGAALSGSTVLVPEPIGIAEYDVAFVTQMPDRIEVAYIKNGKVEVDRVARVNILALDWMS